MVRKLTEPAKPVAYALEVYARYHEEPVASFHAAGPFLPFHPGDLISPRTWTLLDDVGPFAGHLLRVVRCEHGLYEGHKEVMHKVLVYTEAVPDIEAVRWR